MVVDGGSWNSVMAECIVSFLLVPQVSFLLVSRFVSFSCVSTVVLFIAVACVGLLVVARVVSFPVVGVVSYDDGCPTVLGANSVVASVSLANSIGPVGISYQE